MKDTFGALLREKGLRATPGRVALLTTLKQSHTPISAEELHTQRRELDLVTVYRTLQSFVAVGLVREVRFKDVSVRYEYSEVAHHHHLVCTSCGTIDELPECSFGALEKDVLRKSTTFASVDEHVLEFFGTCVACAKP